MPTAWSNKDERQYQKIKESVQERGKPESLAKEIAARTVNKTRRIEGRTPNKTSQGTGNPNTPLAERSRRELYNCAKEFGISAPSVQNIKKEFGLVKTRGAAAPASV
jgi:hypothetical protein